ncbi:HCP-like protein, partial [Violaceomyces palustris]
SPSSLQSRPDLTPQQAYEKALSLLRSTIHTKKLKEPPTAPLKSTEKDGSSPATTKKRRDREHKTASPSYWQVFKSSRAPSQIVDAPGGLNSLEGSVGDPINGPSIGASKDELKWQSARPKMLWPDWEHLGGKNLVASSGIDNPWDIAMFGPFNGGLGEVEEEDGVEDERGPQSPKGGDPNRRRGEAIRLLEWAGWGRNDVDWEHAAESGQDPAELIADTLTAMGHKSFSNSSSRIEAHSDALWVLAEHSLWGTHGARPNLARARACYQRLADLGTSLDGSRAGNASAHARLAFLDGSGWETAELKKLEVDSSSSASAASSPPAPAPSASFPSSRSAPRTPSRWEIFERMKRDDGLRQAKALLHYKAAAEAGDASAQSALGFRHLSGIGVPQSCPDALKWYEKAARQSYERFQAGPPGGLTLPYTKLRLSDLNGGAFGPGASAASTGQAANKPAIYALLNNQPGFNGDPKGMEDMLEYYTYHADHGDARFMLILAKVYYQGSIWSPGDSAGAVKRDFDKALGYLDRITRQVWPLDAGSVAKGGPAGWKAKAGQKGEDVKLSVDDLLLAQAGNAAGMIGKMYLRGEGVKQDFSRAWAWLQRAADTGDPESYNLLGVMLRDGLGVEKDIKMAVSYFESSAAARSSEGCVNLAKIHIDMQDYNSAMKFLDFAIRLGNAYEAYYLVASINARFARQSGEVDKCRLAVAGFKYAVERGDWEDPIFHKAERAWRKGKKDMAVLGWALAGELGYEAAQNNVAWILDRDKRRLRIPSLDADEDNSSDRLALIHWTRSAGQDNVDAMVKMGDYYFKGIGTGNPGKPAYDKAAACYSAAADRQVSALAYWNMGWLYEKGLGVARQDFHLAKRYYDMAKEINPKEAYLPVMLSLIKLHLRALWATLFRSDSSASAISLFSSYTNSNDDREKAYTEAEELAFMERKQKPSSGQGLSKEARTGDIEKARSGDGLGDPNDPETWSSKGARVGAGVGYAEMEDYDNLIEGGLLVAGLGVLAYLAYVRQGVQMRLERERRER